MKHCSLCYRRYSDKQEVCVRHGNTLDFGQGPGRRNNISSLGFKFALIGFFSFLILPILHLYIIPYLSCLKYIILFPSFFIPYILIFGISMAIAMEGGRIIHVFLVSLPIALIISMVLHYLTGTFIEWVIQKIRN